VVRAVWKIVVAGAFFAVASVPSAQLHGQAKHPSEEAPAKPSPATHPSEQPPPKPSLQ
jgi:hypothetical protein